MYTRPSFALLLLLLMAAAGCYSDQTLGISKGTKVDRSDRGTKGDDKPIEAVARKPVEFSPQPGEIISLGTPLLGDVDGDGFDDFVLTGYDDGSNTKDTFTSSWYRLYLFYGRPEWPEQLSTADADAVFETSFGPLAGATGDLNGDGFADLMIAREHSVGFVFGSAERLHGVVEPETAGVIWMAGDLPAPFAPGLSTGFEVGPLGDVDGDGYADIRVMTNMLLGPLLDGSPGGLVMRAYLVKGHPGEWTSGTWDPAWAAVRFGTEELASGAMPYSSIWPTPAGDLNGDGCEDMIAYGSDSVYLFYGRHTLPGELTVGDADATLRTTPADSGLASDQVPAIVGPSIGDLDGDGRDEIGLIDRTNGTVGVVYGSQLSGEVLLEPDFKLQVGGASNPFVDFLQAGDIDGDAIPELLLSVGNSISFDLGNPQPLERPGIYVVRGSSNRSTGTRQLGAADLWAAPEGELKPTATHFDFQLVGDVDGNDGQDIILTLEDESGFGVPQPLYLVPSTPLPPQ